MENAGHDPIISSRLGGLGAIEIFIRPHPYGEGRNNGGERSRRLLGRQIVSLLDRGQKGEGGPFRWHNYGYHLTRDISNHVGEIVVKLQRYEGILDG